MNNTHLSIEVYNNITIQQNIIFQECYIKLIGFILDNYNDIWYAICVAKFEEILYECNRRQIKKYRGICGMTQQEIVDALGESSGRVIYNCEKGIVDLTVTSSHVFVTFLKFLPMN